MAFGVTQRPSRGGSVDLSNYYNKAQVDTEWNLIDASLPVSIPAFQPIMTANSQNGVTITASSEYPGLEAWHVMDGDDSAGAVFATLGTAPHWIQIDFGQQFQCPVIEIQRRIINTQAPNQFRVRIGLTAGTLRTVVDEANVPYSTAALRYPIRFKPIIQVLRIENMAMAADPTAQIVSLQSIKILNA